MVELDQSEVNSDSAPALRMCFSVEMFCASKVVMTSSLQSAHCQL